MSNFTLKLECIGSSEINETIQEAKDIAKKLNIAAVEFEFNGFDFCIFQDTDVLDAIEEYKSIGRSV